MEDAYSCKILHSNKKLTFCEGGFLEHPFPLASQASPRTLVSNWVKGYKISNKKEIS